MKESISYKAISKEDILDSYMESYESKSIKDQHIDRSTAIRHYNRMKFLIKPVIKYVNVEKLENERENTLEFCNNILNLSSNKYISMYIKSRDKSVGRVAPPKVSPLELNKLIELYNGLLNAADFLNDKLKLEFTNCINEQFQKYGQTAFIKPYYRCCNEYRDFFDSITNRERVLMIKRMKRYYESWLKSVKDEYGIKN